MSYKEIHFKTIDSTNTYLKNHYFELDDFTFVSTDYQSKGKGRNDRTWIAKEGESLLFSLLIKNKSLIEKGPLLSLVAAVSIATTLEKYHLNNVMIKWPNDVYVNDKKITGILLEGRIPDYLIIGMGTNVNQKEFLGDYRKTPTSFYLETHKELQINKIKEDVYQKLYYNLVHFDDLKDYFFAYFNKHDYLCNKQVNFTYNSEMRSGVVLGVDNKFNIVISSLGEELHIQSGEIDLLNKNA